MNMRIEMTLVEALERIRQTVDAVAATRTVRVGDHELNVGDPVILEMEVEQVDGQSEFEIELKWPGGTVARPALVGIIGGSRSDFPILEKARAMLQSLDIACELLVVSAHRTPDRMFDYAEQAEARGLEVIIAGAGGAAHLPGMIAAKTHLPVIGVPIPTEQLRGLDSLLSIVQMPRGVPVATVAIGGAENAALLAARMLALKYPRIRERVLAFRAEQTEEVLRNAQP